MAQGEAAVNDEWYEWPMNPLACPIALSWLWLPPSGFLLTLIFHENVEAGVLRV